MPNTFSLRLLKGGRWVINWEFGSEKGLKYRICAVITHGLYIFNPIFHCGLYCRAAYNIEQLLFHDSFFFRLTLILRQNKKQKTLLFVAYVLHYCGYCGLQCRVVCITRNFSELQNPRFKIKTSFKSSYNGAGTISILIILYLCFQTFENFVIKSKSLLVKYLHRHTNKIYRSYLEI